MKLSIVPILLVFLAIAGQARPNGVEAVGITVSDADDSIAFYRDVLGFHTVADREVAGDDYEHLLGVFAVRVRLVRMQLGEEYIELIDFLAPEGRPMPQDSRSNDGWFQHIAIIVSDMDAAYAHLRRYHVRHASPGPQRLPDWNANAGGIEAFYFRDPDGHYLEVLAFPPDKGAARWHQSDGTLFLGIDHTAITVRDSDRSIAFYQQVLGFDRVGESENYGPEQERLNSVFGARLRITALRGDHGPGVELLEYLAPTTGRPMPPDTAANDLWHWQVHASVTAPADASARVDSLGGRLVSTGITTLPDGATGFSKAILVRDPDGHASVLGTPGGNHE